MGRPLILGNGSLTVGLDEQGLVNDFYFPYVGLDNLTNARIMHHKIGVWVDSQFSWVDDGNWQISINSQPDALISDIKFLNSGLGIEITSKDFVDHEFNAFCRQLNVTNLSDSSKDIRVFMHQIFQISRAGRADTALYEPEENYILDYKGRCSLLIYGRDSNDNVFDQYAIGNYGIESKEGTYKDAEDGELSQNAVEHGGVDSVIRFSAKVEPKDKFDIDYWIIASDSQYSCEKINNSMKSDGLAKRISKTQIYWQDWLAIGASKLDGLDDASLVLINKSLMVIKAHTDKHGGIIASCDSSIYNYGRDYYSYVWPRDGAYAIWPLIRLGYTKEAKNFFNFCRDIISPDGYMMHKYQPDKAIGSTWHPLLHGRHKELAIQEDETAIIIYMLAEYYEHTEDKEFVLGLFDNFIKPAADFMSEFIDETTNLPHASYDLWEEKFTTSTYTTALVYRSLIEAVKFAKMFMKSEDCVKWETAINKISSGFHLFFNQERGIFRKGLLLQENGDIQYDDTLDVSSLYGVMIYYPELDHQLIQSTMRVIEDLMLDKSPSGGSPRYEHDHYFASDPPYLGNPWFVTTFWLAQYYIRNNRIDKAKSYVDWSSKYAYSSGLLSEQINPTTGQNVSVAPLVWSHAELVNTILDIEQAKRIRKISVSEA